MATMKDIAQEAGFSIQLLIPIILTRLGPILLK